MSNDSTTNDGAAQPAAGTQQDHLRSRTDRRDERRYYDDDRDRVQHRREVHGAVWALGGIIAVLIALWAIDKFGNKVPPAPPAPAPAATVVPPAPAPAATVVPPVVTITQEEANQLFNRQVGSGPAMQPPGTKMLVISLDRVDDATYGTIYVPNKASGQAITADSPNSPPPPFDLRCPDPTGGQIEAFVTNERARSGRYYVMFRARR